MANVNEGLEIGVEGGLDPNDARDFERILQGKGVAKEEGEGLQPSTDVRSGLTTAEPAQAREPESGRFVAKEAAAADTSHADADTSQVTDEAEADPEVTALLAKYNGDATAALKAAANAQSLLGRQGAELGQTREELAELRGMVEGLRQSASAPAAPVLSPEQVDTQAQALIDAGGYHDAATKAVNASLASGDERVYRSILEQWQLEAPLEAMDYHTDFRIWQREQQAAAKQPKVEQPSWMEANAQAHREAGVERALKTVAAEHTAEDWPLIQAQFEAAMGSMPKNVLDMVGSEDAEARENGVRLIVDRATLLARKAAAATPAAPAEEERVPASVARKLAGAAVASSALKAPPKRGAAPETKEQAIAEFKRQIVKVETTNVQSGLTYGPTV